MSSEPAREPARVIRVGIAGNPNSGKTTLFNRLTGSRQHAGNWPGVTVEKKSGTVEFRGRTIEFVDLPGTYSLTARSEEELIARGFILNEAPDLIVNVVDASNIERNLYLTAQLVELGVKMVVCLNMIDVARERRIAIDSAVLGRLLGARAVETVGRTGAGIDALLEACVASHEEAGGATRHIHVNYGPELEKGIEKLTDLLKTDERIYAFTYECGFDGPEGAKRAHKFPIRWFCTRLLIGDRKVSDFVKHYSRDYAAIDNVVRVIADFVQLKTDNPIDVALTDRIYGFIRGLMREAVDLSRQEEDSLTERLDRVLAGRVLGLPVFLAVVWAMFQITFAGGELLKVPIEALLGRLGDLAAAAGGDGLLRDFLVDGLVAGVGSVLLFLPNIALLFLCIAFLEDSGYMARAAFLMDRFMHAAGLHGKSFISLFMGFGCNAPAVMACRTLENRSDRLITMLIIPLMSCSARFPVYVLFAGTFFPERAGTVIFAIYLTGILLALMVANLARRAFFHDEDAVFVMELPPYRMPAPKNLLLNMWDKTVIFLKKAGGVILVGVALVWALAAFPRDVRPLADHDGRIAEVEARAAKVTEGLETKFAEAVALMRADYRHPILPFDRSRDYLETADFFHQRRAEIARAATAEIAAIRRRKQQEIAAQRYAGRIGRALEPFLAPLGLDWRAGVSLIPGFVAKEVVVGSFAVLHQADDDGDGPRQKLGEALRESGAFTPLSALSFMIFTLLYIPCLSTVLVTRQESGSTLFALSTILYSVALAWLAAFAVFQGGRLLGFE